MILLSFLFCLVLSAAVIVLGLCRAAAAGDAAMEAYFQQPAVLEAGAPNGGQP
jgi:hypothetical protein